MKLFITKAGRVIRQNYIIILIFLFMLFRPQIMFLLRHNVIKPIGDRSTFTPVELMKCNINLDKKLPVVKAGLVRPDDSEDDGCGDDGGSCNEDSDSDSKSDEDYSGDEGCNDDGSCETEDNSYYVDENNSYEDDGCSCAGETVVTSSETDSYYNSALQIKLTFTSTTNYYRLTILDPAGRVAVTLFSNTAFGHGVFYFSWDGNYGNDEYAAAGYYKVVLETEYAPFVRREQNFYFSSTHGFQVNGTSSNVVEIVQ
jgi:hypothetical protein